MQSRFLNNFKDNFDQPVLASKLDAIGNEIQ